MAKQSNLFYRGTVGKLVYYELNGGYYVRSKPTRVNQTAATKASAARFGMAVRNGNAIRQQLLLLLPDAKDRRIMYRLNAAVYKWLLSPSFINPVPNQPVDALTGFQFNEKTSWAERMKLPLQVDWQMNNEVVVTIPTIQPTASITAPAGTQEVQMQIMAINCQVANNTVTASAGENIIIPYTSALQPQRQFTLPLSAISGELAIVAASLQYIIRSSHGMMVETKMQWKPAAIIDAVYSLK